VAFVIAALVSWFLFFQVPGDLVDLIGVLLILVVIVGALRIAGRIADSVLPRHNVAEVPVEGPITRDGGSPSPFSASIGVGADDIVRQIERADEDRGAEALLVRLNTPGGEVVPSDDIRRAAADFEGPVVAYASDTCASGGYWIASGCDEIWAHEASLVGSIGVIGSRPNVSELAEDLGVSYERFAAGKYKDAGMPLKELTEDEREYLQGIVDDFYDDFVERVAEGRDIEPAAVRETEARVYLGREASEIGLVDEIGTDEDVEQRLEELLEAEPTVRKFTPQRGLAGRLRGGAQAVAYALGAGLASQISAEDGFDFKF
jgi:protease-4